MAKERHLGIELLRVLSMGMIVLHHLLTWGGLLFAFPKLSATDTALRLLNAFANCAVNVYALITGYVGSRLRPARLLRQWLQVVFTGLAATLAASLFAPVDGSLFLKALLPVSLEEYWYFSAFFGLMLLTPLLNAALNGLSKRQMGLSLMGCVFLFSLMLPSNTVLRLNGGYHVGWLCVLYLLGGWLRRYAALEERNGWQKPALTYVLCVLLAWGWEIFALWHGRKGVSLPLHSEWLLDYSSPAMALAAVCLLALFARMRPRGCVGRLATWAGPLTFGVYLIHDNPALRESLLKMRLESFNQLPFYLLPAAVLAAWLAVYGVSLVLEQLRTKLFTLLRVDALCMRWEGGLRRLAARLLPDAPKP